MVSLPADVSLAPDRFALWRPAPGRIVTTGADSQAVSLPDVSLPVHVEHLVDGPPSDAEIGQGLYDYLRQFPECPNNTCYVELLRDAYPHFLSDLASHAVMLDAKDVEPAYVLRKLVCLKLLCLLEPTNVGLLQQLSRGYYDLSLSFSELHSCRRYLLEAMRFGQKLLKVVPDEPSVLNLLAEVDVLFGDYPGAVAKWQRLIDKVADPQLAERLRKRMAEFAALPMPERNLVDDLESVSKAVQLYLNGDYPLGLELLERLEEEGFPEKLPSADYYCMLGLCRLKTDDRGGAFDAFNRALEIDPDHAEARQALDAFHSREGINA